MASPREYPSNRDAGQAHAADAGRVNKNSASKQNSPSRYWFLTWWIDYTQEDGSIATDATVNEFDWEAWWNKESSRMEYMKVIREKGTESNKLHWHGLMSFKHNKKIRLSALKKLFVDKRINFQVTKG